MFRIYNSDVITYHFIEFLGQRNPFILIVMKTLALAKKWDDDLWPHHRRLPGWCGRTPRLRSWLGSQSSGNAGSAQEPGQATINQLTSITDPEWMSPDITLEPRLDNQIFIYYSVENILFVMYDVILWRHFSLYVLLIYVRVGCKIREPFHQKTRQILQTNKSSVWVKPLSLLNKSKVLQVVIYNSWILFIIKYRSSDFSYQVPVLQKEASIYIQISFTVPLKN